MCVQRVSCVGAPILSTPFALAVAKTSSEASSAVSPYLCTNHPAAILPLLPMSNRTFSFSCDFIQHCHDFRKRVIAGIRNMVSGDTDGFVCFD
ncbi:hypothetical protein IV203_018006 [Nitzschia inconspicua]|uniref:Uncharacterized protein n=1 Tax=Nitzschia inconspicua TaxID=303405 RepID=A0A9K3Q899_9STRA|nr:hypothetical protein IV203_018006 [Nitzschia inconspicua]